MYCGNCGAAATEGRFCSKCGQSLPSNVEKELFNGTLRANDNEEWKYSSGEIICVEGNPKGSSFTWNGSTFESSKPGTPHGTWNGKVLSWRFPHQKEDFYVFSWDETKKRWNCESGLKRTVPNLREAYVHWKVSGSFIQIEEGSDWKEGASTKWEVFGDMPATHPVVLIVAMFSRSQKLLDETIERSKRVYKRCGKLVLTSAGPTLLCNSCGSSSSERCISCDADCSTTRFSGKICKSCMPRKNFCAKCADPLFGSKKEGFLCNNCGLGKSSDNCAKMVFTVS